MDSQEIKTMHFKLAHAVTTYDRRASTRRGYNPYALGIYLGAVERACELMATMPARDAVKQCFNDRLLDACLKSIGETACTSEEHRNLPFVRG